MREVLQSPLFSPASDQPIPLVMRSEQVTLSQQGFSRSRARSIAWWWASATVCGVSLVWMEATPPGASSMAEVLSARLIIGWMGFIIGAAFGVAGLLCRPSRPHRARRKPGSSISAYDSITGLPTRRLYLVLLGQALSRAEVTRRKVAVFVCALEQFRPLSCSSVAPNMTLVVRVQAARIKSAVRPHDVVARLDEYTFAVIADNLQSPDEARLIAETIQKTIALPLLIEGQEWLLSCRIGGVMGPQQGANTEALLDAAAEALENGSPHEAGSTLLMTASQPCSTGREASLLSPIAGRQEASLTSHR
jgi:diguanylate cyclase (GGDEF)-like protein